MSQSFQNLLNTVFNAIPKILLFLVILVIGWIIARVLMQAVVMLLRKVKFDKFAERGVVGEALGRSPYDAAGLIGKIVYYMLLLVTLQLAFGVFGNNPVSSMLNAVVGWLPKAVVAIILVVIGSAIAKVVKDLITATMGGLSYGRFLANLASIAIIALFAIAALSQIGIAAAVTQPILITVLATVGAILAVGIGGGLIKPMQGRWERMLTAAEDETRNVAAYQQGRKAGMKTPAGTTTGGSGAAGGSGMAGGSGAAGSPAGAEGSPAGAAAPTAGSAGSAGSGYGTAGPSTQQMPAPPPPPEP
ncbi:MAG TPA: hypothetical protein VGG16_11070 [Streptosporangiaceae bacterium]